MAFFSYEPARSLKRATSIICLVGLFLFFGLAVNQFVHHGDVFVLIMAGVLLTAAVGNFGVYWLGWKSKSDVRP